jgi:hypothetical protein
MMAIERPQAGGDGQLVREARAVNARLGETVAAIPAAGGRRRDLRDALPHGQ